MGSSLADNHARDGRPTCQTRFIAPAIYPKIILEPASPIHPINAGPVVSDPVGKHLPNGIP